MIPPAPGIRIWVAAGVTDMRRGFDGLAAMIQQQLGQDPFSGALFLFRGRRGHLLKILAWDGQGLVVNRVAELLTWNVQGIRLRLDQRLAA
jgi:transposase